MKYIPKRDLSRLVGRLAEMTRPRILIQIVIRVFAWKYRINLQEAEKPLSDYSSLVAFFTRKLKPGVRPLAKGGFIHPCDSEILANGPIESETLIQAKGITYTLEELVPLPQVRETFAFGHFATYYLCPTDYHRVHSPVMGEIRRVLHIPGELWPVHKNSVQSVPGLYAINERVYVEIQTREGEVGVVFVGATNVGSIELTFDPSVRTNVSEEWPTSVRDLQAKEYQPMIPVQKGADLGCFRMGSTVILLLSSSVAQKLEKKIFAYGKRVKMGEG